jgi:hypothetical protein
MEKYVSIEGIALAVSLVLGLMGVLVGHVLKMWREARKNKKDMGRLKAGSVWRFRPKILRNNPFDEDARHFVKVLETRVNSDGRMWVKYLHKSGLEESDPADVFVDLYTYVEEQDLGIKADEVQRIARGMVRIVKQEKMGTKTFKIRTGMREFKQWMEEHPRQNLTGFFSLNGRDMTDAEIRRMVSYAVENGYETDADIPSEELARILS